MEAAEDRPNSKSDGVQLATSSSARSYAANQVYGLGEERSWPADKHEPEEMAYPAPKYIYELFAITN